MRDHYRSSSPYEGLVGFARAVRHGDRIVVSGTAPIGPDGQTVTGDAYVQAKRCFEVIIEAVEALGGAREVELDDLGRAGPHQEQLTDVRAA